MNVSIQDASASPEQFETWHQINWHQVNITVRGIQIRIAKAVREGKWRKVNNLQRMLTRSFSGKALAVKRVTENRGKRTPGIDGVMWSTPDAKWQALRSLVRKGYKPSPLRRIHIPKKNGKKRPLGIPTMKDRAMQALYKLALEPVSEVLADWNSYGFRTHRSTKDASCACFNALNKPNSAQWIFEADIAGCFDHISHEWLLENIPMDKSILRKWLKAGFMESKRLFATDEGTPQGGIISPMLANMTLDGLERELRKRFKPDNWKTAGRYKMNFIRYADDFIITGVSQEFLESEVRPVVEEFLAERGLSLSAEKTKTTHIDKGFDFLGFNVRKYNGVLLIKPSKENVKAFLSNIRETIKSHRTVTIEVLLTILNPKIEGWGNYHKHIVANYVFNWCDYQIFKALWRWAKRRHPMKGRRWIKDRYFKSVGKRNWVFATTTVTEKGDKQLKSLRYLSEIKIVRHTKIRVDVNHFNPEDEQYFEKRQRDQMLKSLTGRKKITSIWKRQKGICPCCQQLFSKDSIWDIHHIVRKSDGGSDNLDNLVMLHTNCHRQVHSLS